MARLRHLGLNRDPFAPASGGEAGEGAGGTLHPSDARIWILDRLAQAGGDAALIAPGALAAIVYAAGGSAVCLQRLASAAMQQAASDDARRIEMAHARRAITEERTSADTPEPDIQMPLPLADSAMLLDGDRIVADRIIVERAPAPRWAFMSLMALSAIVGALAVLLVESRLSGRAPTAPAAAALAPAEPTIRIAVAASPQVRDSLAGLALAVPVADDRPTIALAASLAPPPTPARSVLAPAKPTKVAAAAAAVTAATKPAPSRPAGPRLLLRYASEQPGGADAAARTAALLRARGYQVSVAGMSGRIRQASVRFPEGRRSDGEAINDEFERVLGAYQPGIASLAIEGDGGADAIELWLPDSAAGASRPLRTDVPPV